MKHFQLSNISFEQGCALPAGLIPSANNAAPELSISIFINTSMQTAPLTREFRKVLDEAQRLEILISLSTGERYRLFYGQFKISLREHLFLARKISVSEYVKNTSKVEDRANW